MTNDEKTSRYELLCEQCKALIGAAPIERRLFVGTLSNICAAIHESMEFFWTGFYLVDDAANELVLGPFQGPVACFTIPFGRGVCGTAWQRGETIVVPDVEQFPGHIACSSLSRSEIVVPVTQSDGQGRWRVVCVLDIDSRELATFDDIDKHYLEAICNILAEAYPAH